MKCTSCKMEINDKASKCPYCGQYHSSGVLQDMLVIGGIIALIFGGISGMIYAAIFTVIPLAIGMKLAR